MSMTETNIFKTWFRNRHQSF